MKFPKKKKDISKYHQYIVSLLDDADCAIFIDTNVISQLYRLNDTARQDFYSWMDQCGSRFHVPVWVIHEYSNKVYLQKTKEYLSELDKIKTHAKEFNNISDFVKGYIGDTLLQGSIYQGEIDKLKEDVDKIKELLERISNTINKNLNQHQRKVHEEIEQKMTSKSLSSDIYSLIQDQDEAYRQRCDNLIPPGYKDASKDSNKMGDLIIWKEILEYCKSNSIKKAVLLSRDSKPDIVYSPEIQIIDSGRNAGEFERVKIAKESLIYEFQIKTGGTDFCIIDFKTFVQLFASKYRGLAISFQIATAEEETANESPDYDDFGVTMPLDKIMDLGDIEQEKQETSITTDYKEDIESPLYIGTAIRDGQYDTTNTHGFMDSYIEKLKSYDWYIQNPAINKIMRLREIHVGNTDINRSSIFVLGRNITQCAEGSSGSAISFLENYSSYIKDWEPWCQKALIDGILYEVFFNSNAEIRPLGFKATYFEEIINNINKLNVVKPFEFINDQLSRVKNKRFVPQVGTNRTYEFEFLIESDGSTKSLKCNGENISDTFKKESGGLFSIKSQIKEALMTYYAIPQKQIIVTGLSDKIINVNYIYKHVELPF